MQAPGLRNPPAFPTMPIFGKANLVEMRHAFLKEKRFRSSMYQWYGLQLQLNAYDFFRGKFQAFYATWNYVLQKSTEHQYFSMRARSSADTFFVGVFDALSFTVYGEVLPLKYVPYEDKELYLNLSVLQLYNPVNKLWITPCTYGKSLAMLFPLLRQSLRQKVGKTFRPLPIITKVSRFFFLYKYEWNIVLIRKHKYLLLIKTLREYAKKVRRRLAKRQSHAPALVEGADSLGELACPGGDDLCQSRSEAQAKCLY